MSSNSPHSDSGDSADDRADRSDDTSAVGDALRTTLLLLALGAVLVGAWRRVSHTHHRRRHGRSKPLPERLQTWEGEGGRPHPEHPDEPAQTTPQSQTSAAASA